MNSKGSCRVFLGKKTQEVSKFKALIWPEQSGCTQEFVMRLNVCSTFNHCSTLFKWFQSMSNVDSEIFRDEIFKKRLPGYKSAKSWICPGFSPSSATQPTARSPEALALSEGSEQSGIKALATFSRCSSWARRSGLLRFVDVCCIRSLLQWHSNLIRSDSICDLCWSGHHCGAYPIDGGHATWC